MSSRFDSRVYLDTSAYLEILLNLPRAEQLRNDIAGAQVTSSVLLIIEARRNLIRLARQRALDDAAYHSCVSHVDADVERFELRQVSLDLFDAARMPAVQTPRTLDLIHLWTALWFHAQAPLARFITLDAAQERAARELGLPVG